MKVLAILLALAATAHAEPRNTVSLLPRGFAGAGLAIEGERDLPAQRVAIAIAVSARSTAGGDYDSATLGVGAEARHFFRRAHHHGLARGWYAALRLDLARTSLSMDGASLGAMSTTSFGVRGGYRWVPWRGLEVRPYAGIAVRRDAGGGAAAWRRGGLDYGLALGWSF